MIDMLLTALVMTGLTLALFVIRDSLWRYGPMVLALRGAVGKCADTRTVRFKLTENCVRSANGNVLRPDFCVRNLTPVQPLHAMPAAA